MTDKRGEKPKKTFTGRIICRYGHKCRFVNQPEGCSFAHPKCKNGDDCEFLKQGKCRFFHPEANNVDYADRSRSKSKGAQQMKITRTSRSASKKSARARSLSKKSKKSQSVNSKQKNKNGRKERQRARSQTPLARRDNEKNKKEKSKKKQKAIAKKEEQKPEQEIKRTKSGRIICKYGFRCYFLRNEDSNCRFFHPRCKNGDDCQFAIDNACGYFHGKNKS